MDLLFEAYTMFQSEDDIARGLRGCIIQMASLQGTVFSPARSLNAYLSRFLRHLFTAASKPLQVTQSNEEEVLRERRDLSTTFLRIVQNSSLGFLTLQTVDEQLGAQSPEGAHAFVSNLAKLTCTTIEIVGATQAGHEEEVDQDALDIALQALSHLIEQIFVPKCTDSQTIFSLRQTARMCAAGVFECYVKLRLQCRVSVDADQSAEGQRERQLQHVGVCGRVNPQQTLSLLVSAMSEHVFRLINHSQLQPGPQLEQLQRSVAWLATVLASVLCDARNDTGCWGKMPNELKEAGRDGKVRPDCKTMIPSVIVVILAFERRLNPCPCLTVFLVINSRLLIRASILNNSLDN